MRTRDEILKAIEVMDVSMSTALEMGDVEAAMMTEFSAKALHWVLGENGSFSKMIEDIEEGLARMGRS